MIHPDLALYRGERVPPVLPVCEHFAGSEKTMRKALSLQAEKGPLFDVTLDCEDGAPAGHEIEHAKMVGEILTSLENRFQRVGFRIHDYTSPFWMSDLESVLAIAGKQVAYITIPKCSDSAQIESILEYMEMIQARYMLRREIPVHVLIETHGALAEAGRIASMRKVETLDFGLMDFVSAHNGAIPSSAMSSPGQFDHALLHRAKTEIAAAAIAHGVIPSHNVTTEIGDGERAGEDARRARQEFGYLRMWSIHPVQIDPIVHAMSDDFENLAESVRILREAQQSNWGPIKVNGKLHDRASYRIHWTLIRRAKMSGSLVDEWANQTWFVSK